MTAALMWFNGCEVDAWAGKVLFVQSPKSNGAAPCMHLVPRHWWIAVKNLGIVDLSPDLSVGNSQWDPCSFDYVFGNKVVANEAWKLHQVNDMEGASKKLGPLQVRRDQFACIYVRQNKRTFTGEGFLTDRLITNQDRDCRASAALLCHLNNLLRGESEPLVHLPVMDAWMIIRAVPEDEVNAVTSRF